jgi:general secretion pathway protein D
MMVPSRGSWRYTTVGLLIMLALAGWPATQAQAASVKVTGITMKEAAAGLQMSIVASGPVQYQVRDVRPNWVVVDVLGAELGIRAGEVPLARGVVKRVRVGQYTQGVVRVVVELAEPVRVHLASAPGHAAILVGIPGEAGTRSLPDRAQAAQMPIPPPPAPASPATPAPSSRELINLDLRSAEIADVLSALAKLAGVNIVTDTEVKGKITVRLTGVTFDEAMRLILEPNGLGYATVGSNLIVMKKEKLARPVLRQYQISNMLASTFVGSFLPITGLKKEQVVVDEATNSIFVVGPVEDHAKVADMLTRVDQPAERAVTRVIKLSYIDGTTFVDLMGARLSDVAKATKIDKASNSLVMTATAAQMQIVDALLQQVDTALPQVMIESMVVEVPTEEIRNLGVAWQSVTSFNVVLGTDAAGRQSLAVNSGPIVAVLNTLIQNNKSRLLANPRLAVRDGETATMNIGDKIPFQVINAQGVPSVVIIEAGVKLNIQPRINSDGFVTVRMHPEVSSIKTPPGPNVPPTISTREADSSITVKDGTPIILAGLIRKDEINTTVKVPLLGDIPILGWLFKSTSSDKTDNEVVFVITPHILAKPGS